MANEKSITLNNLKTFKAKADATYAKKTDIAAVNNGKLTIQKNGSTVATFTANQSGNATANITVPTKLAELSERTFGNITSRGEEYLEWGGPSQRGIVSPIGMALSDEHSANRVALINPKALLFEYSSDGGATWTQYPYEAEDNTKRKFCTTELALPIGRPNRSTNLIANKSKTRITITAQDGTTGYVYTSLKKMLLQVSTPTTLSMLIERRKGTDYKNNRSWESIGTYDVSGWTGWNDIPVNFTLGGSSGQTANYWQMRLTITCTKVDASFPKVGEVQALRLFGDNCWTPASTLGATGHLYSYNMAGHATFPGNVYANGFYANGTISTTNGSISGLSFIEGGKKLSERYLGISAKAADSLKLDGHPSSYYLNTNTEQYITGKKYFETDLNFGKYVSAYRAVGDAPANLHLMNSSQTTAGFFDTVIFAGAGDWLYLGHLKPTIFSIKASYAGNAQESDRYDANLGYTRGCLDSLTNWDYQDGWCVYANKISTTTPAIIQIKFTRLLYTDVLRLILTGHNLRDVGGDYSGFLDDYTIEVCTDYAKDTWTTVVNRTNASDNIGKGLIYALQTGSYTSCYGIRLKITKCHVTGKGVPYINITTMQLRDYRPGIKFPDCLGAISQGGGDVWGQLNTKNVLQTRTILPEDSYSYNIGASANPYAGVYATNFYENGTALSDKYLAKGYLERLSPKLFRHTIKIEGYSERTTGTALVCMLQVDSSLSRAVDSFVGLATVLGSIDKETGEPGIQTSCKVSGGIVVGSGNLDYILPLIRLETDGIVSHTVFVNLINEYPDLSEDVDSRYGHLSDYSTVTYTDSVTPVS